MNLKKYMNLINKLFAVRKLNDDAKEDEVLSELDHHWYKEMDQATRDATYGLILFEDKERYTAFKKAWKDYIHEGKHKKYKFEYESCANGRDFRNGYEKIDGRYKCKNPIKAYYWKSDLHVVHHLLYALLRNKKINKMFKPSIWPEGYPATNYATLKEAAWRLNHAAKGNQHTVEYFLRPFGGTLTLEDIQKADRRLKKIAERTEDFKKLELE